MPDGRKVEQVVTDRLNGAAVQTIDIPEQAVPGSAKLIVKLYPGVFSQVVEGLDGMLRMPCGCFEQTSSTTYPNILVADYLKKPAPARRRCWRRPSSTSTSATSGC